MKVEILQQLVIELSKDQPQQKVVKDLMLQCELPFSSDPIQQLAVVLETIDQLKAKTEIRRKEQMA